MGEYPLQRMHSLPGSEIGQSWPHPENEVQLGETHVVNVCHKSTQMVNACQKSPQMAIDVWCAHILEDWLEQMGVYSFGNAASVLWCCRMKLCFHFL